MIEVYHSTNHLQSILREGLKAPYQLSKEGKGVQMWSAEVMDSNKISEFSRFLCKSVMFFDKRPVMKKWVSILLDEKDDSIRVGNSSLVRIPYDPGELYEQSIMSLAEYLQRERKNPEEGQGYQDPVTSELVTYDQMEILRVKYEKLLGDEVNFEYAAEFLVPKLLIPPADFYRTSVDRKRKRGLK